MRKQKDPELMTAKSLKKEYDMFLKYSNREGIPKIEQEYYRNIVNRIGSQINWKMLDPKRKPVKKYESRES